jgi:hypothetical protein
MTPKALERLEAEAAEQRQRVAQSWTELQESVQLKRPARAPRARHTERQDAFTGKLIELCLFAVAAGCLIELYRRVRTQGKPIGTEKPRPVLKLNRISKGEEKWKTRLSKKPRKSLPATRRRVPLLPRRASAPILLPDLTAQPHRLN